MKIWAFSFPASEVLQQTWGVMALILSRTILAVITMLLIWLWVDGLEDLKSAPWSHGLKIGGIGFGMSSIFILVEQKSLIL